MNGNNLNGVTSQKQTDVPGQAEAFESGLERLVGPCKLFFFGSILVCCTVVIACVGARIWRVESVAHELRSSQADYAWRYETFDVSDQERPDKTGRLLASWLGNSTVSDISLVRICKGDPNDQQLRFLSNLQHVRSLELQSDQATDRTVEAISGLPKLRYLTLVGNRFSVLGLLQLRNAVCLRQLTFDFAHYSAIELAVLKTELPGVLLANADSTPTPYRSQYRIARQPSA